VNLMRFHIHTLAIALTATGACLVGACSKTTTSMTAPSSEKCAGTIKATDLQIKKD
jgi:hypothetical protein